MGAPERRSVEKRILFVVCDRALREYLAQAFGDRGFRVITASDGVGGLFQLGFRQPDLVVLAVNGWETLQRIRALSDIPVIVLVEDTQEARIGSLNRGADCFVVNPPSLGELDARVRVLFRRQSGMLSGAAMLQERAQDLTDLGAPMGI